MFKLYFTALKRLAAKETNRYLRIWVQTLVPPVITTSLYFVIFGNLIGGRIGEMGGFSYMEFIVPGLIMMSVITSSYANVASSFFSQKFQKNIEELLVAPVPTQVIIFGFVAGGVGRRGPRYRDFIIFCAPSCLFLAHHPRDPADDCRLVFTGWTAERHLCQVF